MKQTTGQTPLNQITNANHSRAFYHFACAVSGSQGSQAAYKLTECALGLSDAEGAGAM
jgi:hypothetical protein